MGSFELLEKELCYQIVGYAMNIMNTLGHGFREKTYENALCLEFKLNQVNFSKQSRYPVIFKNEVIDEFIPDIVVDNRVIVELKTVESIIDEHRGQLLNYLRITGIEVGLILNFKHPKLKWEHLVLEKSR